MNVTKAVWGIIVCILVISCTKEKPREVIQLQEGAHPCFQARAGEYSVEYAMTFTAPETATGHMSVAVQEFSVADGKYAKSVTKTTIVRAGKEDTLAFYLLGDKGHHCVAKETEFACTELPAAQVRVATGTPGSQVDMEKHPEKYGIKQVRTETLLDEQVACCEGVFKPTPTHEIKTEYCYTNDGIPLKIISEIGEVTSEVVATSVKRSVDAAVFEVPNV